jgi:flagellar protein FliS
MNYHAFQTYRQTDIITADSKRLIIMCYEGVIQNLGIAKLKYISNDYEAKGKAVQKALELINALREALNFKDGGEIAKNLDKIYAFSEKYIIMSDIRRNIKGFEEVITIFGELKFAWEQALFGNLNNKTFESLQLPKDITQLGTENAF